MIKYKYIFTLFLAVLLFSWGQSIKAKESLDFSGSTMIIDVRTPMEYHSVRLKNAINIPLNEIENKIRENVRNYNAAIILYCESGRRADIAKRILENMGYKNVINAGGLREIKNMAKKDQFCEGC